MVRRHCPTSPPVGFLLLLSVDFYTFCSGELSLIRSPLFMLLKAVFLKVQFFLSHFLLHINNLLSTSNNGTFSSRWCHSAILFSSEHYSSICSAGGFLCDENSSLRSEVVVIPHECMIHFVQFSFTKVQFRQVSLQHLHPEKQLRRSGLTPSSSAPSLLRTNFTSHLSQIVTFF